MAIPQINFVPGGSETTRVGLGGEGVLRTHGRMNDAIGVIGEAVSQGITYFDSAPAYASCQSYLGAYWKSYPEKRSGIFQAGKSARRLADEAWADLHDTLAAMNIRSLDLWQIHDLRTREEFDLIGGPGGALEAFQKARDKGLIRHIGVTGHHDPYLLAQAVEEWPVDAVLLPVNPAEANLKGFMDITIPAARDKGIAVVAMKILGGSHYVSPEAGVEAKHLIRFALAQPITLAIVGCQSAEEVKILARVGTEKHSMPIEEQERLKELFRPQAKRLAFYRGVF